MLLLLACTRPAPDAPEPCAEQSWYRDADHDGWGLDADVVTACVPPDGYISVSGDCDDGAVDVNPGATESCTLGDDDCDGVADPDGSPGCTDDWTDADGDGYGEGDAVCSCTPSGVAQGGDCDDGDADRILDCTEGAIVPLAGDRLLDDDPEENWWLLAAGDAAGDGQPDILLAGRAGLVAASLPSGDTLLSAATVAEVGGLDIEDVATLDLDGDGGLDVLTGSWTTEVLAAGEGGDYDWLAIDGTVQAFGADFTPLWSRALPTVEGEGGYTTLFGADFDGDGFDEPYAGLTAAYVGTTALWRVDDPVTTIATADDGSLGEFFPVGDLDGDGVDELAVDAVIYDVLDGALGNAGELADFTGGPLRLGDLDGDGYPELGARDTPLRVYRGPVTGGDPWTTLGPESDEDGDSALNATAGDVGADGVRDLLVTDTYWPSRYGDEPLRGGLYIFTGLPEGTLDLSAADVRIYGENYGLFGAYPKVLDDGRLVVGAHAETTDVGTGAFWLLEAP